jgi:hypothetical protein
MAGRADRDLQRSETARADSIDPVGAARDLSAALVNLSRIAKRHRFDALVYLLEMAQMEARQLANPPDVLPPR